jgi:hypothetical protein
MRRRLVLAGAAATALVAAWWGVQRHGSDQSTAPAPAGSIAENASTVENASAATAGAPGNGEAAVTAAAARGTEEATDAERSQRGRLTSSVRGALAGVVRACASHLGDPRSTIFIQLEARIDGDDVSLANVDVRTGVQTEAAFARCVLDRSAAIRLPLSFAGTNRPVLVSLSFTAPP